MGSSTPSSLLDSSALPIGAAKGWRRFLAFSGPAYLISVGYMDPGNWAADLEGGARFGYQLLWVLLFSNLAAILMQTLAARLGIATGRDLAQTCRARYPRPVNFCLWVLCETAIAACDLAELLGAAIGLKLLFGLPLLAGVAISVLDTFVLLSLSRYGIRTLERVVLGLVAVIGLCFAVQIWLARPDAGEVARGLIPSLNGESLYVAIAMMGATIMPHNLYLHSALVQTREIGASEASKRDAARWNLLDSALALNASFLINGAILVLSAAVFYSRGVAVHTIEQAHQLLTPLLGTTAASILFATALILSGQSSTITGTMAGQVVMEGFLNLRMQPWLRRLITRLVAVLPAAAVIFFAGEAASMKLLIFSQVVLSLQLPFALVPLIHASEDTPMGSLRSRGWLRVTSWVFAALIVGLNAWLVSQWLTGWVGFAIAVPLAALLSAILVDPWRRSRKSLLAEPLLPAAPIATTIPVPQYRKILVPIDHSELDGPALEHACALARTCGATVLLLHVEEGVASQLYGSEAQTAEETEGAQYLERIRLSLRDQGIDTSALVRYSSRPRDEIIAVAASEKPDLVVMGGHGHTGLKDLVFGSTINHVRHHVRVPVLVVRR